MTSSIENKDVLGTPDKTALLVVSFGTSYEETRKKTIEAIENKVAKAYPDFEVRRAFTSEMIIRKLKKRDNLHVDTPEEAVEKLISEGFDRILVQSLHVINGFEYDDLVRDLAPFEGRIKSIKIGRPLLSSHEDYEHVVDALAAEYGGMARQNRDTAVVLMGHGTEHHAFSAYPTMTYFFKRHGYPEFKVGCVEGIPGIEEIAADLKNEGYKKVILAPFMLVAGDHALNDMASDEEDSWKTILEMEGFEVTCVLKGIGEMDAVQTLYLKHLQAIL